MVTGRTSLSSTVLLYDNGIVVAGPMTPDVNGAWQVSLTLAVGDHQFYATATNANGVGPESVSIYIVVDTTLRVDPARMSP